MNLTSGKPRGCGTRKPGGLYACVGLSANGRPLEDFIIDPALEWRGGPFRGVEYKTRPDSDVVDIIMWVGAEHYPFMPNFVEEGRQHGFSKRIPTSGQYHKLIPHQSIMFFVHPKVYHHTDYRLRPVERPAVPHIDRPSPDRPNCDHGLTPFAERCTYALWDLSVGDTAPDNAHFQEVVTPSVTYEVMVPESCDHEIDYKPGIFMALPFTHFEFVGDKDGELPNDVATSLGGNVSHTAIVKE